ncbi:MAG: tRNA 4-thiouridine(8) synthase ThiI, partial [Spirochaetaceae bacterium]|nr:tRNA 4-thiouridine(8) synthase ThiI [Spirochaetaceae bacterium]
MAEKITYLAKLGELTLKGSNLKEFENRLVENARLYLETVDASVRLCAGRLYIEGPESSCAAIEFTLSHLIGITGWARAIVSEKNIESIRKAVFQEAMAAKNSGAKTFKVDTRRADKSFPMNSYEISCEAAADVFDANLLQVDVHKPDALIRVEIRERCFV